MEPNSLLEILSITIMKRTKISWMKYKPGVKSVLLPFWRCWGPINRTNEGGFQPDYPKEVFTPPPPKAQDTRIIVLMDFNTKSDELNL